MQVCRGIFVSFNASFFQNISVGELVSAFVKGVHFDFVSFMYFNVLFLLLSVIPGDFKYKDLYQKVLKVLFVVSNSLVFLVNLVDIEYFQFNFKRATYNILGFIFSSELDVWNLIPQFAHDFWHIIVIWALMIFILIRFYPKVKHLPKASESSLLRKISQSIIAVLLFFIALVPVRGIGIRPINLNTAALYSSTQNMHIVLNTPYTIVRTIGDTGLEKPHYFSDEDALKYFNPYHQFDNSEAFKTNNVVILILESFSKEYVDKGYTPFLDSLSKKGLFFNNAFANGKRSIQALPSIFASIPALMDKAYATSEYSSNQINSIASVLKEKGYHTSFFHGGRNGTMGFDAFTKIAQFDNYYGLNEYPEPSHFDGHWGIFDEEYLSYYADKLNTFEEPFMSSVFTLSSHHPYTVPKKYKDVFKEGEAEITKVISYSDYALKRFFEKVSKMDWYHNTLFVITADHTGHGISRFNNNRVGGYRVPILFYHPSDTTLRGKSDKMMQQADIFPSILDYMNCKTPFIAFGNSAFREHNSFSTNYSSGVYTMIKGDYVLLFDGDASTALYNHKKDPGLRRNIIKKHPEIKTDLEQILKAYIQSYNTRVIDNQTVIH